MQHVRPSSKGDPLCPLGFHPQVRWPARCKRCFRDYKEHGNRKDDNLRRDDLTVSTPALSSSATTGWRSRMEDTSLGTRSWTSSSNLSNLDANKSNLQSSRDRTSTWTSTPNLAENNDSDVTTVNITLPRRRRTLAAPEPEELKRPSFTRTRTEGSLPSRRSTTSPDRVRTYSERRSSGDWSPSESRVSSRNDWTSSDSRSSSRNTTEPTTTRLSDYRSRHNTSSDVDFMLQVKSVASRAAAAGRTATGRPPLSPRIQPTQQESSSESSSSSEDDDSESVAATDTTEATLVNTREKELQSEVQSLKKDLETSKQRCEKLEREKSDIMLRRLETPTTKSEALKLQQKVNELKSVIEDLRDDKRSLSLKVREVESELDAIKASGAQRELEQLRSKMDKADLVVRQLRDENQDMRKELRDMEEEMLELQDTFREDQADEYTSLKKELEQTTKNCRILTFKLRKAERKSEQLDAEKLDMERRIKEIAGGQVGLDKAEKIRQLEHELSVANEAAGRLQKELEETQSKLKDGQQPKKKPPKLGSLGKTPSAEKASRDSLVKGSSQEDPVQLLRDLQDSLEREADLREQLRFAEEEAESLRKKSSRIEDDNESLVMQLKKMATKARTRRHSPNANRLTPEPDKDEGISDEDDPAELRILLELNEQEASVLRRKVEELESEIGSVKNKNKELQEKLSAKLSAPASQKKTVSAESTSMDSVYKKKLEVVEGETNELRMKLIEKERECERLHAEISLGAKKSKVVQKSKSLDGEQQAVDLKRQLQVIESEASILRTKIQDLESENDKLLTENKRLIMLKGTRRAGSVERTDESKLHHLATLEKQLDDANKKIKELQLKQESAPPPPTNPDVDKLKTQLKKAETSRKKAEESLKRLKEESLTEVNEYYKKRSPRQATDITTKLQLKKMVDESENEISELVTLLKKFDQGKSNADSSENDKLITDLKEAKKKLETDLKSSKDEFIKKDKELVDLKTKLKTTEQDKTTMKKESDSFKSQLEKEKTKLEEANAASEAKKKELEKEVTTLKNELKDIKKSTENSADAKKKLDTLTKSLEDEKKSNADLKKQLQNLKDIEKDKKKLQAEVDEKGTKSSELEKRVKELEEKIKKNEKLSSLKKEKIAKLEKEKGEQETKLETLAKDIANLEKGKKDVELKMEEGEKKMKQLQSELEQKSKTIEDMSSKSSSKSTSAKNTANLEEIKKLKEELNSLKESNEDLKNKLKQTEEDKDATESIFKSKDKELRKECDHWERKASELEMDLQAERKMMERLKASQELEIKAKDQEISQLQSKNLSTGTKKYNDLKQEMQSKIDRLELALKSEKREYDELTAKYEQLEEEHVVIKSQLVKEKENLHSQLLVTERDLTQAEEELKTLKDSSSNKHDSWIKEKTKLQDRLKEAEQKVEQHALESTRLVAVGEGKQTELDQVRRDMRDLEDQYDRLRKDNEELRHELDDYDKVVKVQRSMAAEANLLEKELKEYKTKLVMEEKNRKADLAAVKSRYENRVSVLSNEMLGLQAQVARFKKERDYFKKMADTQANPSIVPSTDEDVKSQFAQLEQQMGCLEDELSEARLESSKLRTQLLSERSSWEVKMSELNSKLNELEEEKILSSGRTKVSGVKTRMELAWHKEREEQQRLLQETSTLARDLRQTLFEVEREKDRERLEAKRRLDQVKKNGEEEHDELRKKLHDMQCDLLELRDAHAKLRTTNEKLRRERDRWDRERDAIRQSIEDRKRLEREDEQTIISVARLVDELTILAPDLFPSKPKNLSVPPTPPSRKKSKSREVSPLLERRSVSRESSVGREDAKTHEVQEILLRLTEAAQQLKRAPPSDRTRRANSHRAGSIESDSGVDAIPGKRRTSLRKSFSLEQTDQVGWGSDNDREGSVTSVQSYDDDIYHKPLFKANQAFDSRLSGGSTKSEIVSSDKKKKTGLIGKLRKLTKAKSIDSDPGSDIGSTGQLDPGSDTSLATADDRSSKPLRDKLSGMFKRSGSSSRGNSVERSLRPPTDSLQRPLVSSSENMTYTESSATIRITKKPPTPKKKK